MLPCAICSKVCVSASANSLCLCVWFSPCFSTGENCELITVFRSGGLSNGICGCQWQGTHSSCSHDRDVSLHTPSSNLFIVMFLFIPLRPICSLWCFKFLQSLHKTCFRCVTCSNVLQTTSYATINDKFYCLVWSHLKTFPFIQALISIICI